MRFVVLLSLAASTLVCTAAAEHADYFVYRTAGKVPFDSHGVPQLNLSVSSTRVDTPTTVYMAKATFNDSLLATGWDTFAVAPDPKHFKNPEDALLAWYAAGFAEGYATQTRIWEVLQAQPYNYSAAGQIWVDKHLAYVHSNAMDGTNPFWVQVRKQLLQMYGMAEGYNRRAQADGSSSRISFADVFQANLYNEYSDIGPAAQELYGNGEDVVRAEGRKGKRRQSTHANKKRHHGAGLHAEGNVAPPPPTTTNADPTPVPYSEEHCSGLVKLTEHDLFISHVTWCGFFVFVGRQYKTYYMETTVSMSSNAILINSGGDWYQTSNKLGVIETTNEFTTDLYKLIIPECVSEFMRVMVANFLANSGKEWTNIFSQQPSGTYCNQWMVLDYKLYTKGMTAAQLPNDLFWILETIPGLTEAADMTWFLRQNGYWGSYNIPYFPKIYAASGFQQQLNAYGSEFSWEQCPRAQIFRRDHNKVTDLASVQRIMRYNDWQNEVLSTIPNCNDCVPSRSPMVSISSRGDLVPSNASFGNLNPNYAQYFEFAYFGATDAKVGSYDMITNGFKASFINGPTHDQQPVFSWSVDPTNPLAQLPGMPQVLDFEWETVAPPFMP